MTAVPATASPSVPPLPDRADRAVAAPPDALVAFVDAGVLDAADVHVAEVLTRRGGDDRDEVLLAAALAVRAPRRRHVCVDLTTVRDRVTTELGEEAARRRPGEVAVAVDAEEAAIAALPWPDPAAWRAVLATSQLVATRDPEHRAEPDDAAADVPPLTLAGDLLYLDRYWRYERRAAAALDARARRPSPVVSPAAAAALDALFTGAAVDRQRVAAATALRGPLTVLAGGPGTGKTTTVARILQVLSAEARATGAPSPRVALAAPTGKAAARLTESLREAADHLTSDDPDLALLRELAATTLHRLLGARGRSSRFRHHAGDPLPHDVIIVDETSMVPLALLAKLVDAVRDDTRLVLVGDPHQLASVEAGSVLADLVGDPDAPPRRSAPVRAALTTLAGVDHLADTVDTDEPGLHDAVVVLDRVHRYRSGSGLDRFAVAVRRGDADAAIAVLREADDLHWIAPRADRDEVGDDEARLAPIRARIAAAGQRVRTAAIDGDATAALAALDEHRVLCAHRRGRDGVAGWTQRCEGWLREDVGLDTSTRWYVGRPVLVTANDRRTRLWNGDLGVVVAHDGGVAVAFPGLDGEPTRQLTIGRVGEVETVHAMTVHKSQGSQVGHAVVVLPDPASRLCTRELLYTGVTRARDGATIVASEAALRATIATRTQRASGLRRALAR